MHSSRPQPPQNHPGASDAPSGALCGPDAVVLHFGPHAEDSTLPLREALDRVTAREVALVFKPGRYVFCGDYAHEAYLAITNHDNGLKRIVFPMDRFDSVRIEGNGAEFVFHGRVLPFLFKGCRSVALSNLTIDWDLPFYFQAKVSRVDATEGWMDLAPYSDGFSWSLHKGRLRFPEVEGSCYGHLGETLAFDPLHRRVAHGAVDLHLGDEAVEQLADGHIRLHARLDAYPEAGSVLVSKGKIEENRYAPAIYGIESENIHLSGVTLHHALGMGFLFERCDGVTLSACNAFVPPGSDRMVSLLADATHFCNCRGEILVENCRFQHMLDDGTNVHGTYVVVDAVPNERQARVRLMHFQQFGFQFAEPGDEVWLIHAPDPGRASVNRVQAIERINERFSTLTFEEPVAGLLKPGDLLENKTWNPSFTMRGCTITDHRARSIVLKTPRPILIEGNHFSSMMSAVLFRGESRFWFESGSVSDALIRNNTFDYCAYSGTDHAILRVAPRLGKGFSPEAIHDRNIRFEGNQIHNFHNRIVWAERVDGLRIAGNRIVQTTDAPNPDPHAPMIELAHCRNVTIEGNSYVGNNNNRLRCDRTSAATLTLGANEGMG